MKQKDYQYVINQQALENFDKVSTVTGFTDGELVPQKPLRDPQGNKQRDQRRLSKKDRWDD